jgi:hypothetical protein
MQALVLALDLWLAATSQRYYWVVPRPSRSLLRAARSKGSVPPYGNWGGRIRTSEWRLQRPLPYHLATPQQESCGYSTMSGVESPLDGFAPCRDNSVPNRQEYRLHWRESRATLKADGSPSLERLLQSLSEGEEGESGQGEHPSPAPRLVKEAV